MYLKIYIKNSQILNAGRGVFATRDINKGEIIETCPVIYIPKDDPSFLGGVFINYFYFFGKKKDKAFFPLGFGSLYNHSPKPNARYKFTKNFIEFIAAKNIKKDEEILVNYNSDLKNKTPLWFE